ncbi:MAG: C4-dicarboxylate ABC transporter [Desulfuromonas sp.]|nr:MAG: C4-dicarboxylate ABC transporter [Desulfuromonas sp.]
MLSLFRLAVALLLTLIVVTPSFAKTFKIATIAPAGSAWMEKMRQGADEISKRTAGRVKFKFYGGGVMGNEKSVLRKIRVGQLQGGAFTAGSIANVYPDIRLYGLPLTFNSYAEVDAIRPHFDPILIEGLKKAGFASFGFAEAGFALMMGNGPIETVSQLQGKKVWVPEGDDVSYATMKSLGLSPVTLPVTDVMTGLQTGLLDIVAASPVGAIALQWHTRIKYLNTQPLAYIFGALLIDQRAFSRLSAEDQATTREVMSSIYTEFDQGIRPQNDSAFAALLASGITQQKSSETELAQLRQTAEEVNRKMVRQGEVST